MSARFLRLHGTVEGRRWAEMRRAYGYDGLACAAIDRGLWDTAQRYEDGEERAIFMAAVALAAKRWYEEHPLVDPTLHEAMAETALAGWLD